MSIQRSFLVFFLLLGLRSNAQYRYDNIAYQTVYLEDLCQALKNNPGYLLLDVRSPGEFHDTSSSASLNIGRLKGAVNMDVGELPSRWKELLPYKDKPIFVYCSHSQRSRKCSKLLSDSGFTRVINVNGAMTEFNLLKGRSIPCAADLYETDNKFVLLAPQDIIWLLTTKKDVFILDTRSDSAFHGISTDASANAMGRFKGAYNIPFAELPGKIGMVPKGRPVLVVGVNGRETNLAATMLAQQGYSNLYAAFNGLFPWISTPNRELPMRYKFWDNHIGYSFISAEEMDQMLKDHPGTLLLDVRTRAEYTNTMAPDTWKNRGHVRNAVNIPVDELAGRVKELQSYLGKDIIVYAFGNGPESYSAAGILAANGFTKVRALTGGLWDIRWKAANIKGLQKLNNWVVDVPLENQ